MDLTGKQFGRLTVVERIAEKRNGNVYWLCRCNCSLGTVKPVASSALRGLATQSCGVCPEPETSSVVVGTRFGQLTTVCRDGKSKWICRCDCGIEKSFYERALVTGARRSCGRHRKEREDVKRRRHERVDGPG